MFLVVPERGNSVEDSSLEEKSEVNNVTFEEFADNRIWRARQGIQGVYVVYPSESEALYFALMAFFNYNRPNRAILRVFPISLWRDGECITHFDVPRTRKTPYLPSCVLYGKCDTERLPDDLRDATDFVDAVVHGIQHYDETHPRRERAA